MFGDLGDLAVWLLHSLVARPPPFLPPICIHNNNTQEQKTGEKRERPGSIHHVSGREVDIGGEGPIFKYIRTKLVSYTYRSRRVVSVMLYKVWSLKMRYSTRTDGPARCFGSWTPPPRRPPDVFHVMNAPRPSPF